MQQLEGSTSFVGRGLSFLLAGNLDGMEFAARVLLQTAELLNCRAVSLRWFDDQFAIPDMMLLHEDSVQGASEHGVELVGPRGNWRQVLLRDRNQPEWLAGQLTHQLNGPLNTGMGTWGGVQVYRGPLDSAWTEDEAIAFRDHCLGLALVTENRLIQGMLSQENDALKKLAGEGQPNSDEMDGHELLAQGLEQALALTGLTHGLALKEQANGNMRIDVVRSPNATGTPGLEGQELSSYKDAGILRLIRLGGVSAKDLVWHDGLKVFFDGASRSFVCLPLKDGAELEGALLLGQDKPMGLSTARLVKSMAPVLAGLLARTLRSSRLMRDLAAKTVALEAAGQELIVAERLSAAGSLASLVLVVAGS